MATVGDAEGDVPPFNRFSTGRGQVSLKRRKVQSPLGPADQLTLMRGITGHSAYHTGQIRSIKNDLAVYCLGEHGRPAHRDA